MKSRCVRFGFAAALSITALYSQIPATDLCNTGLTPAGSPSTGCTTSSLVTPINPSSGGDSVDGNWQLATPYPSLSYTGESPDPCTLTYGPAWVDAIDNEWFNPSDGKSQYISPFSDGPNTAGGWYIYRTALKIPPAAPNHAKYLLVIAGKILVDDYSPAIVFGDRTGCKVKSLPSMQNVPGQQSFTSWNPFAFREVVDPGQVTYIYAVVFNVQFNPGVSGNYTGLRLEFTSASFTPID